MTDRRENDARSGLGAYDTPAQVWAAHKGERR